MKMIVRRPLVSTLVAAAVGGAVAPSRAAAQTYDYRLGQSFTAPLTAAPLLEQLVVAGAGIGGAKTGAVHYEAAIFSFVGGARTGPALFRQSLGTSFSGVTLGPNLALLPGGTYAVLFGDDAGATGNYTGRFFVDSYAGGSALFCFGLPPGASCDPPAGPNDMTDFAVTFGTAATTTPEPGSLALTAGGVLALVGAARRRRDAGRA